MTLSRSNQSAWVTAAMALATGTEVELSYSGGFNVDPAKDGHIHAVSIALGDDGSLKSTWTWYEAGEAAHPNELTLWRQH